MKKIDSDEGEGKKVLSARKSISNVYNGPV
jgi:hypothetical protein